MSLHASYQNILAQELQAIRRDVLDIARLALDFYEMGEKGITQMLLREALDLARSRLQLENQLNPTPSPSGQLEANDLIVAIHLLQDMVREGEDPRALRQLLGEIQSTTP